MKKDDITFARPQAGDVAQKIYLDLFFAEPPLFLAEPPLLFIPEDEDLDFEAPPLLEDFDDDFLAVDFLAVDFLPADFFAEDFDDDFFLADDFFATGIWIFSFFKCIW